MAPPRQAPAQARIIFDAGEDASPYRWRIVDRLGHSGGPLILEREERDAMGAPRWDADTHDRGARLEDAVRMLARRLAMANTRADALASKPVGASPMPPPEDWGPRVGAQPG